MNDNLNNKNLAENIKQWGLDLGFDAVGISNIYLTTKRIFIKIGHPKATKVKCSTLSAIKILNLTQKNYLMEPKVSFPSD